MVWRVPAAAGEGFRLRYIHSVERVPVEALFRVDEDGGLRLVETRFSSHGPGLPARGLAREEGTGPFVSPEGARMGTFRFYVSAVNEAELALGGRRLALCRVFAEGEIAEVAAARRPRLLLWLEALGPPEGGPGSEPSTR